MSGQVPSIGRVRISKPSEGERLKEAEMRLLSSGEPDEIRQLHSDATPDLMPSIAAKVTRR